MSEWTVSRSAGAFIPEIGRCYEISFGDNLMYQGKQGNWTFKVRCDDTLNKARWIDLDTCKQLDPVLWQHVVMAWREIPCTDCP